MKYVSSFPCSARTVERKKSHEKRSVVVSHPLQPFIWPADVFVCVCVRA